MLFCFAGARPHAWRAQDGARRRALLAFLLLFALSTSAEAQANNPAGVSVGAALWAEIGGNVCSDPSDVPACTAGLDHVFPGGSAAFDLDLLHWLRLGVSAGLGYSAGESMLSTSGERTTSRHWFVPLTVHTYWRVELGKRITLWGGPELGLGLYVDQRRRSAPSVRTETEGSTRSAFLAGVALGLDVRLSGPLRVGVEIGESVLVKSAPVNAAGDTLDLRAMTRVALLLRYL